MNGFYWIYMVMFALLLAWHFAGTGERKNRLYCIGCGVLILLFAAQDISVSVDLPEYMRQYALISTLSFGEMLTHKFEIGYVLLNWLLALLFKSDRILILVMSILIMVPFGIQFQRESEEPMMALMSFLALGIYMHALIYFRQLCAMGILTFSFRFIRERKPLQFLLVVLAAMTFHKSAAVFAVVYVAYAVPVNWYLMIAAMIGSAVIGVLGGPILWFIRTYVYPDYPDSLLAPEGGVTMLVVLWIFTFLVYWLMRERLSENRVKLPFMMLLIAAVIQPVALTFYNWARIVLFFRVAMVLLVPELYVTLFQHRENNKLLAILENWMPGIHRAVLSVYDTKWFRAAVQIGMFAVLFAWYVSELDGAVYTLAPV